MTHFVATVRATIPYTALASPETLQPHCLDRWWPKIGDRQVTTCCENGMVVVTVERALNHQDGSVAVIDALARFDTELGVSGLLRRGAHPARLDVRVVEAALDVEELAA